MKGVAVKFSNEAEAIYNHLNRKAASAKSKSPERQIFNSVNKKVELIKSNFQYGRPIAKSKIPAEWADKYGISDFFWVELPHFWRMFYSLEDAENGIEIIAFVVNIIDHKTYDKLFCYRG